jgi:hypothetical protein
MTLPITVAVRLGMNCLHPLKHLDRGFGSHLRCGCQCAFILCLCSSVRSSGPATG